MMTGRDDVCLKPALLGGSYAVMKSYTKPYASCRYTHPAVEAAIRLRDRVPVSDIESVSVRTYDLAVSGHDHTDIPGSYSAKMSIPYATAAGLIYGRAGLNEFSEAAVGGEEILALTKKISVCADEQLSAAFPGIQAAIVTVETKRGESYTERVDFPKGEPENPMTDKEFRERYDALMEYARVKGSASAAVYDGVFSANAKIDDLVKEL